MVFPTLFRLAINKQCSVKGVLSYLNREAVILSSASNRVRRRRLRMFELADLE